FTYGGNDTENCGEVIAYEDITQPFYWQFRMKKFSAGTFTIEKDWEVISDTGTSFIGVPTFVANMIAYTFDAEYDEQNGIFLVKCGTNVTFDLTIGKNVYTIESKNLVYEIEGICLITMFPMDAAGFGPQWILGDPFIRQYCNIYDMGKQKIGFAKPLKK
ncbi:Eukaryotic aspartyl protease, partial [Trichostrongylus colubriformis]